MQTFDFLAPEITQADIAAFATDKVNLKSERANQYREQVRTLREHLDRYISEHPDIFPCAFAPQTPLRASFR